MEELRPRVLTLGHPESEVFNATIHGCYGATLQSLADRDKSLAVEAVVRGMEAIFLQYGEVKLYETVIREDTGQVDEHSTLTISCEDDGARVFDSIIRTQIEQSLSEYQAAIEEGRGIIVRAVTRPGKAELPISDDKTFVVATI